MKRLLWLALLASPLAWANTVTITWTAPTTYTDGSALTVAHYNIYRGGSATTMTKLTQVGAVLTYIDTTGMPGQYYAVSALDGVGTESVLTRALCYRCRPSAPTSPRVQ